MSDLRLFETGIFELSKNSADPSFYDISFPLSSKETSADKSLILVQYKSSALLFLQ